MKVKIKLTPQQQELLYVGNKLTTSKGKEIYSNCFFYERVDKDTFTELSFNDLPEGLKKIITEKWLGDIVEYIKTNK